MPVPCIVEIEGVPYEAREPYVFATLPRVGELISLEWENDHYPEFVVYSVKHVPNIVEGMQAFTVLFVRKTK